MKLILTTLAIVLSLTLIGQSIDWASKVLEVSSEYSKVNFSANKILGEPDAMAVGADPSNAWRPSDQSMESFIVVSFDKTSHINQILIAEAKFPGSITRIIGYDKEFRADTLIQLKPINSSDASGYYHQFIPETDFDLHALRVEFDATNSNGLLSIDAIGVANQALPITAGLVPNNNDAFFNYSITRLGDHVNSKYRELNPIVSLDGKTLYFSRQKDPNNVGGAKDFEDIWYCNWNDDENRWGPAKNLGAPLNTIGPNFISSISLYKGQEVFLLGNVYDKKGKMRAGVSMAVKTSNGFSQPLKVDIENDYNISNNVDYFLTHDGKALMISANRDDSYGGRDLYVCFPIANTDTWSSPMNLGELVNSSDKEESPFVDHDGKTLYFSSNREGGNGGLDLYRTTRLDSTWTRWSVPKNLGSKINGEGDEEYLSLSSSGENLYYTRSEPNGNYDIYDVNLLQEMVTLSGKVVNEVTNEFLDQVDIYLSNAKGGFHNIKSDENGGFQKELPAGTTWVVSTSKDGFEAVSFEVIGLGEIDFDLLIPLKMTPLIKEVPKSAVTLTDQPYQIYFDLNSSYLRPESKPKLLELANFMTEQMELKIELSAHTDSRQSQKYNMWMSERRANRVKAFLIDQGIEAERITAIGYGETRLLNDCVNGRKCSEEEHQKNRRTEIKILKE